ncbi:MAG: hypothetical protein AAGJ34_08540 [Pseudomonadota bacterium]
MKRGLLLVPACGLVIACSQPFATQQEIDRCVDFTGVQDSAFRVKQVETTGGVKVTLQDARGMNETQRLAVEECIEDQVNARRSGRAIPVDNPSVAPPAEPGKLPLPTEFPLQPGDAEIWPQLTRAEQERAIEFLRNGSTIRQSLKED